MKQQLVIDVPPRNIRIFVVAAAVIYIIRSLPRWLRNYASAAAKRRAEKTTGGGNRSRQVTDGNAPWHASKGSGRGQPRQQPPSQQELRGAPRRGPPRRDNDSKGPSTAPALWTAVENGDVEEVTKLLENGHDVNEAHKLWTPIMKACEEGHTEIAEKLLDHRCDIEAVNKNGRSALSFAAAPSKGRQAYEGVLQLLLEAKADVNHKDARGNTARARATRERHRNSVRKIDEFLEKSLPLLRICS